MERHYLTGVLLAASLALVSCGKSDEAKSAKPANPQTAAQTAPAAPATPAGPPSAQQVASRLAASGIAPALGGFTVGVPITCEASTPGDDWAARCRAMFYDSERDSNAAVVEIQLFDSDMDFTNVDKALKANILALGGDWTMDTHPDITIIPKGSKIETKLPAACHQSLGQDNSRAYCTVMATPRAYLVAAVFPKTASTKKLTISTGGGSSDTDVDIDHAQELMIQSAMSLIESSHKAAGQAASLLQAAALSTAIDPASGAAYGCEAQFGVTACKAFVLVSGPAGRKIASTSFWGAVAISSAKMNYGYSYRFANAGQAEAEALRRCVGVAGATDCKIVFDAPGYCAAIAMGGGYWGVGGLSAATDIAEKEALLQCRDKGCAVKVSFCADNQPHVWGQR